jgi:hypothetical protein
MDKEVAPRHHPFYIAHTCRKLETGRGSGDPGEALRGQELLDLRERTAADLMERLASVRVDPRPCLLEVHVIHAGHAVRVPTGGRMTGSLGLT